MPKTRGIATRILQLLSEKCCISYADLMNEGIPKKVVWTHAVKLEKKGIIKRIYKNNRVLICLKICSESKKAYILQNKGVEN